MQNPGCVPGSVTRNRRRNRGSYLIRAACQCRLAKSRLTGIPKNNKKPAQREAGFLLRLFPRERRYADLGYLLPSSIGPAVKTRCIGPSSWLASYTYCSKVLQNGQ